MSSPLTQLTPQGLTVANLSQRVAQLTAAIQALPGLGPEANLDPDSFDGQIIGILSESYNNLDQLLQKVWQSFNPNTATGVSLALLCLLNNIVKQQGFYSIVTMHLTGNPGGTVPAGTQFQSTDGNRSVWQTENDVTFDGGGVATVNAQCTVLGPVTAAANVITTILTPSYDLDTATNPVVAIPGANDETDAELRIRRAKSTSAAAQSLSDALEAAISDLPGVQQCRVWENSTDSVDGNGQAAHSINVVVLGGTEADILKKIWIGKSFGCDILGAISGDVIDSQGNPHTLKYDTPTDAPLYIILDITPQVNYPATGDADITAALVAWFTDYQIGEKVITSQLYIPVNNTPGVSIRDLKIGLAPSPTTSTDVTIPYKSIATLSSANITINHV